MSESEINLHLKLLSSFYIERNNQNIVETFKSIFGLRCHMEHKNLNFNPENKLLFSNMVVVCIIQN